MFKVETVLPFSDQLMLKVIRDDIPNYTKWNVTIKMAKVIILSVKKHGEHIFLK